MFYAGDLQSGIALALQQSKFVVCFVRDDEAESAAWENDYLRDTTLSSLFSEKTVLLRLPAGSQEANFLAAIYPLPKSPTLVIIHNGQLKEYLTAGVSKADFVKRVKFVLGGGSGTPTSVATEGFSTPVSADESDQLAASAGSTDAVPPEEGPSHAVTEVLAERRSRLESKKKEQDAAEKAERAAKAAARKEVLEAATPEGSKRAADMKYALMQKKRQEEARNERARILKRVEDDKAERRAKEALRKEQVRVVKEANGLEPSTSAEAISNSPQWTATNKAPECAVQVRLFDGTTIRSRFPSHSKLGRDVRRWVDGQRVDGDIPYTFKQILTPQPNRAISVSEEEESLQSLGLTPSVTLILVPVKDYTTAYEGGVTRYIWRGISAGFGLVSSGVAMVTGALGSILGGFAISGRQALYDSSSSAFGDQRERPEEHQLYNGNALNFEPRRDEDDKKD